MYLIPGILGFVSCCLFDINKIRWQSSKLNISFVLGILLILFSTVCCILQSDFSKISWPLSLVQFLYIAGFILSSVGLVYTLFFALPFGDTYMESDSILVIDHGVYGICRHPGFWMLTLVYLFLWLFFDSQSMQMCFILYTACNFIYILIQDKYIFPQYIKGYDEYKKSVPFLIPKASRK